jgi:SOUL heme-binding protein
MKPLAPAFMNVYADGTKTMQWPLDYCLPGQTMPTVSDLAASRAKADSDFGIVTVPSRVVAVRIFGDALVEPVVRRVDKELRDILRRDGLVAATTGSGAPNGNFLQFAQYDAVYSMGKRRSEVHIALEDGGHPW